MCKSVGRETLERAEKTKAFTLESIPADLAWPIGRLHNKRSERKSSPVLRTGRAPPSLSTAVVLASVYPVFAAKYAKECPNALLFVPLHSCVKAPDPPTPVKNTKHLTLHVAFMHYSCSRKRGKSAADGRRKTRFDRTTRRQSRQADIQSEMRFTGKHRGGKTRRKLHGTSYT